MNNNNKIIGRWLLLGVAMLVVQVLLGGITRLTGSGLSITEWKPLLGAIPPMHDVEWNQLFQLYQEKTGQFKYLNNDFTLSDFKFIFFWEWMHREWARLISIVFLIPFIYFIYKKMITKEMIPKLIGLFVLGAAQGLIGWIMVASGLNDQNLYVTHITLATHFLSAMVLICFTYWFAISLLISKKEEIKNSVFKKWTLGILIVLFFQLMYGAFMAGLKAATAAPTWPSINGDYFPSAISSQSWINHPINIHFFHRMIAYLLIILIGIWYAKASKINDSALFNKYKWVPFGFVILQIVLGIFTVLTSTHLTRNGFGTFEYLAQAHQLIAMFLVLSFVWVLYVVRKLK
jgi:cytochrome c oxidase assembly protein subunit 15